ncbi:hypothetical protein FOA43_002424 [Brettanomyces nanus]|uniref:Heat shock transcription factor n=1 Tax=Eeniella nana TaxID=13502 RepID=A0A875S2E0_EENNA|nr:uncharacterized protein FOA43_002424 [Brettanomyces nanus]QPG75083.1 hypothetical protein FOA43_002424 [Brettanomyces nanus]
MANHMKASGGTDGPSGPNANATGSGDPFLDIPEMDAVDSLLSSNNQLQPTITTPSSITTTPNSKVLNPDVSVLAIYGNDASNSYTLSKVADDTVKHESHIDMTAPKEYYVNNKHDDEQLNKMISLRKPKGKKIGLSSSKRPAFVMKLWNMVNDKANKKYIRWIPDGKAFQVSDRESFMKYVLPKYFKHNNFASFVRQLNMYGWHKIQDINSGSLIQGDEVWQFENPNFVESREDLLDNIVRNKPSKESGDDDIDISALLAQLEAMRKSQKMIEDDLSRVRQDNEMLWKENYLARERHKAQSETLEKILRFLATVYGNSSTKLLESMNVGSGGGGADALDFVAKNSPAVQNQNLFDYHYGDSSFLAASPTAAANGNRLMISNKAYTPHPSGSVISLAASSRTPHSTAIAEESPFQSIQDIQDIQDIQEIHRGPENRNLDTYPNSQLNIGQSPQLVNSPRGYFPELPTTPLIQYRPLSDLPQETSQVQPVLPVQPVQLLQPVQPVQPVQQVQLVQPAQSVQPAQPAQSVQPAQLSNPGRGRSSSLSSNPEELMGNIHSQLNKNQGTLKQMNEWISKLSGKPSEDILDNNQDDLNGLLMPQSFDLDGSGLDLPSNKINELYDGIRSGLDINSPTDTTQSAQTVPVAKKRKAGQSSEPVKRKK